LLLIVLLVKIGLYVAYWCMDRFGNRQFALGFLIVSNILGGGIWLWSWILEFSPMIYHNPDVWLFSPAPIVIPTMLYFIAWLLMRTKIERKPGT